MSETAIKFENISKQYHLGKIGTGTLSHDLNRWWAVNVLRKEDPYLKVGEVNDRTQKSNTDFVWALKNIDFEVKQGEVLGIIGKNGAGKSTLLKILSRVTTPTTGRITSYGRIASLLEVGTGFHPEMTGRENIFMNGSIMGMSKAEIKRKFDEIVDFAGIERYIDTPVKRYSSGMTVRLGFAIAAHLEPEILVVDEVLAVGDAEFQKMAIGKMQDVSKGEGRTVLFVSHNMASISQLCSRCIVLNDGSVSYAGKTEDAISYYLSNERLLVNNDLLAIENRSGSGQVRFKEFFIEDKKGRRIESVLSGDRVSLCFRLESTFANVCNIDLGFSIHTLRDELLTVLYSSFQHIELKLNRVGDVVVRCEIKEIPFEQGEYILKGRLLSNTEESDWPKEPIGRLNVINGDFYRTGNPGFVGNSRFLIKGKWDLVD